MNKKHRQFIEDKTTAKYLQELDEREKTLAVMMSRLQIKER